MEDWGAEGGRHDSGGGGGDGVGMVDVQVWGSFEEGEEGRQTTHLEWHLPPHTGNQSFSRHSSEKKNFFF